MKKYLWFLLLPFLLAAAPTRVNNFSTNTTIRSAEVNEDLNNLYGHLAKGVTNSSSYWLCENATCTNTCQIVIDGGIITGCN